MSSSIWEQMLTLVFPHKCFCCGKVLAGEAYLCGFCADKLPETMGELCTRCGKKTDECVCAQLDGGYTKATAPFYYLNGVPHGIHRFKYNGRRYYAAFLGERMSEQVQEAFGEITFDCITYVPMHRKKQRERGFCQTELLADKLSERLGVAVRGDILLHTGKGKAQIEQHGLDARIGNAQMSYATYKAASLEGERVLLVDDVLTTCSTAQRCAQLLLKKGAAEVYVITAATTCGRGKSQNVHTSNVAKK